MGQVGIATGVLADDMTITWDVVLLDEGVGEAAFPEGFGFEWATTTGVSVAITVGSVDESTARAIVGDIRSVDGVTWEQMRASVACDGATTTTVAPDRSVTTGTGSPADGRPCVGPTGTTLAPTTTVTEPVEP